MIKAYLELTKPRVVALMLLTALIGMLLATPGAVPINVLFFGITGIALAAGSAATINHLVDQKIDAIMGRTKRRPLPTGKVTPVKAMTFAITLAVIGMAMLVFYINTLTAVLTFVTLIGYAVVYTMFLKWLTPQNIVIGGAAGAAPPLLGWTAVTGHVDPQALLLVLIIFVWTPPHFWALAIHRYKEYEKADVPMLPVTHGIRFTKLSIFLYTILLVAITLLPFAINMLGWLYLLGAIGLGLVFIYYSGQLFLSKDNQYAMPTFRYSIIYLILLFTLMLVDHYMITPEVPASNNLNVTYNTKAHNTAEKSYKDLNGNSIKLSQYQGKWVLVNYWASWCKSCYEEIPELNQFYNVHKGKDAMLLGVNYDLVSLSDTKQIAKKMKVAFPVLASDPKATLGIDNVPGLPTTFITNCFTRIRFCDKEGRLDLSIKGKPTDQPKDIIPWFKVPHRANQNLKILFGHWAALEGKADEPNVYALDTGCVWGGALSAMRLEDEKWFSVKSHSR